MRISKAIGCMFAGAAALVAMTSSSPSRAGDESLLQATCSGGAVTVTAVKPWHPNKAAPWKWDKGAKVSVDDDAAKFKGDKCEGTVKAFVCQGDQCKGPIVISIK